MHPLKIHKYIHQFHSQRKFNVLTLIKVLKEYRPNHNALKVLTLTLIKVWERILATPQHIILFIKTSSPLYSLQLFLQFTENFLV